MIAVGCRVALLMALAASTVGAVAAPIEGHSRDKRRDADVARAAVLRHEVLPLPRVMALVAGYQPGDIIEVELKNRPAGLHYDVHVLVASGEVRKLLIDARTGRLLANTAKRD